MKFELPFGKLCLVPKEASSLQSALRWSSFRIRVGQELCPSCESRKDWDVGRGGERPRKAALWESCLGELVSLHFLSHLKNNFGNGEPYTVRVEPLAFRPLKSSSSIQIHSRKTAFQVFPRDPLFRAYKVSFEQNIWLCGSDPWWKKTFLFQTRLS